MVEGITLMVLGVLAAPSLLLSRKPNAKQLLDKIAPYQGWIGAVFAFYGLWTVISWGILGIGNLATWPIFWVTVVVVGALEFSLGMLLGVGVLKSFIKAPQAQEKMDMLIARLAPKQGLLGMLAIGVGVWCIVANFLFYV